MKYFDHFQPTNTDFPLPYLVTRPDVTEPGKKLPLLVFLHGAGERGDDERLLCAHGPAKYFSRDAQYLGQEVIVLSPQCPKDQIWSNFPSSVMELILYVAERENADMERIAITGLSMGGFGTWSMLAQYPDFFSAAAPICGGGVCWYCKPSAPVRAFHGDMDDLVPIENSRLMVDAVNKNGGHAELTVYPGCGHNSWEPAYETTDLIPWLIAAKRR